MIGQIRMNLHGSAVHCNVNGIPGSVVIVSCICLGSCICAVLVKLGGTSTHNVTLTQNQTHPEESHTSQHTTDQRLFSFQPPH